ncbi:TPA: cobalamin biosynthesis protein [Candidatus Bathyarchaeota archaeon]|nr:cobalamin biosynthesis protein [Candidatus Bathyarchaeota archaeon]
MIRVLTIPIVAIVVLIIAIVLDLIFGDPSPSYPNRLAFRLHPTVLMGRFTKILEPHLKKSDPRKTKINGILLAAAVIMAFAVPTYFGLWGIYTLFSMAVYAVFAIVLLKLTICIKLETDWAKAASKAIEANDLVEARKYSHFSRRESRDLTGAQIGSSVIESMAENLIDFKLSPIIAYSFLGVSGAIAFRAVNTLDGMVGFKDPEHIDIGWFSANLDTVINYVPARLTAILIVIAAALAGEDAKNAWLIAKRDHAMTPSRNHGWPMAAMAGALRVRLEKPGQYVLGEPTEPLSPNKILSALRIRNACIVLCVLFCLPIIVMTRLVFFPF